MEAVVAKRDLIRGASATLRCYLSISKKLDLSQPHRIQISRLMLTLHTKMTLLTKILKNMRVKLACGEVVLRVNKRLEEIVKHHQSSSSI